MADELFENPTADDDEPEKVEFSDVESNSPPPRRLTYSRRVVKAWARRVGMQPQSGKVMTTYVRIGVGTMLLYAAMGIADNLVISAPHIQSHPGEALPMVRHRSTGSTD